MTAWALRTDRDLESLNVELETLEAAGLLGIAEEDGVATAYFPEPVAGLPVSGRWEVVPEVDWVAQAQGYARAVRVGPLVIAPPWLAASEDEPIVIVPGPAFGTGDHETTEGCLAALCETGVTGRAVLDVGTGTGVLAIAAARLGARRVVAVDTDPAAVAAAEENARANGAAVTVVEGSAGDVAGAFDVVVANLDTDALRVLADELVARLGRGGTLIASGVSRERRTEAVEAFAAAGLEVLARPGREWVVLTGRRP